MKLILTISLIALLSGFTTVHSQPVLTVTGSDVEIKPIRIALLIPLCTKYNKQELIKRKLVSLQEAAVQYYQGLKLALDSLKKFGLQIQLDVYDTDKDSLATTKILKREELKEMDLIIGPFFKQGIELTTKLCNTIGVYHIAPAISVSFAEPSPWLILPNSEITLYADDLLNFVLKSDSGSAIYVLTDGKKQTQKFADKLIKIADSLMVKVIKIDGTKNLDWSNIITEDRKVSIAFPTANDALVQKLFKSITDTGGGVRIYGIDNWLTFKNANYNLWENYHVTILAGHYVDYTDEDVKHFVSMYHRNYFAEPTEYSFKAFDQIMSIAGGWLASPTDWKQHPDQWGNTGGLGSNISYTRDEISLNIINKNIKILRFENYKLKWVW